MKKIFIITIASCLALLSNFTATAQSPTVTINQDIGQLDPTSNSYILFSALFSEEVSGFDGSDISFTGSTVSGTLSANVTGGPRAYTIRVTGMTSSGNVVISIPAGAASPLAGGASSLASTHIDNTVSFILPSISCPGNLTVGTTLGSCDAIVNNIDPIFSPANAEVTYTIYSDGPTKTGGGSASGKTFTLGLNTIIYTLPQYPGVFCNFTIVVKDLEPPKITCPANITVSCLKDIPTIVYPTATDNCTSSPDVVFVGEVRSNEICQDRFTITRTFKATDRAQNSSTCTQIIIVNDTIPPYFFNPPPTSVLNVSCTAEVPIVYPGSLTAIDECAASGSEDITATFKEVKSDSTCPNKYTLTRTWTAGDACGNEAVFTQVIHVDDKEGPQFEGALPSPSVLVSCAKEIPVAPVLTAMDNCTANAAIVAFREVKSEVQCANKFKLTRTWTATDACGNTATHTQVIVVEDKYAPVFDGIAPSIQNVSCTKEIPAVPAQTATDNCGGVPMISFKEVKSNIQCANRYTLTRTWTATDSCGNSSSRVQVINVNDNQPPVVSAITADRMMIWPPNHKMQDVTINYNATDNCEVFSSLSVSSSEAVHGGSDGDQAPDWEIIDAHHVRLRAEKANNGQARIYTITVTVTDSCNTPVVKTIEVVVAHNITGPQSGQPFKIGSTVNLSGVFWDKPGNTHTARWLLDGSVATNGIVTEPSGNQNGKVGGSYKFSTAGVYKLQMNVIDQTGTTSYANTNNDLDAIVVIYDPNGGNAFGGGWFNSPAGALAGNDTATGKASYGFAVNYRNAAKPKGETQFEFKVGAFEFNALNFEYLSISGGKAQFRGTGKIIGGQSGIGFIMTVRDGAVDGSGADMIRMKIYNRNTGHVYYDNQRGASDADDPVMMVGTNSTIVIQAPASTGTITTESTPNKNAVVETAEKMDLVLSVIAFPNPSSNGFTIQTKSGVVNSKITMQLFDQLGRPMAKYDHVVPGSTIIVGEGFKPGVYYLDVIQGSQRRQLKLVKL